MYMWQNLVGGWKMLRGAKWRETMKECTTVRSIFKERGRDGARGQVEGDYEGVHKCEIDI